VPTVPSCIRMESPPPLEVTVDQFCTRSSIMARVCFHCRRAASEVMGGGGVAAAAGGGGGRAVVSMAAVVMVVVGT